VVDRHPNREPFLSLFVVPKAETRVSEDGIQRFLQQQLPEFMVPACLHVLPRWPLTSSGKVDRQALIALNSERGRDNNFAAPCSEVEKKLARIWEGLLNVRPIGIREHFLEIGGNSLLTVRLFAKIEETFGARLPVAALLAAPNIEQLAAMIATKRPAEEVAYARPIQAEGGYPSFFCVGAGPLLWPLAAALGRNQPFFTVGIEPDATDLLAPPYQIERLACYMASAILEKQPQGPYYLGGFCHDGLYAYEVAQQLLRQGHQIGLLALFETECPFSSSKPRHGSGFVRGFGRLKSHGHKCKNLSISKLASSLRDLRNRSRRSLDRKWWSAFPYLYRLRLTRAHKSLEPILYIAGRSYKPQSLNCPVAIFRGRKWPGAPVRDAYLGWHDLLSGPCETYEVEGDHAGIFIDDHLRSFAELLGHCLHRAHPSRAA
jgi:thioesterase domain-containing protein/acyl carrier protein